MPLKKIDYDNIHFYKIVCNDFRVKDCYVGHTSDFTTRKAQHKCACNNINNKHYDRYMYEFMRENGGWENWDMILIETLNCENGLEARKKEREHIENLNATLNLNKRPIISPEERYERTRQWAKEHPEQIKASQGKSVKALQEKYPDRYKQYASTRWERHKHRYLAKVECECGSIFSHMNKCKHIKSKKHQQYIQSLEQSNPQE